MKRKNNNIKRVIIVLPFFSLGGAETQALRVAELFKETGNEVIMLAFENKSGLLKKRLKELNIQFGLLPFDIHSIHRSGFEKLSGLFKLILFFRKLKPDYIFPFTYYPNIICSAIWRFTQAKRCFWNQRGLEHNSFNFIEKIAKLMKPTYLSNSIAGAKYIISRHNLGNKVKVIKNGVEVAMPKQSAEDWKQKLLVQSELIYTMVANFYPEKNHKYLIDGWILFNEKFPTISKKLVLVGYATHEKFIWQIKANVFDRGLENIIFLESSDDISGLLSVTNVGILTSEREGCPNSVLEMMKLKVPVIVSRIPATEEIFEASYPLFCELEDPNSLLLALEKTLSNHLISDVVNKNFENVNSNYNFTELKRNYLNLVG